MSEKVRYQIIAKTPMGTVVSSVFEGEQSEFSETVKVVKSAAESGHCIYWTNGEDKSMTTLGATLVLNSVITVKVIA